MACWVRGFADFIDGGDTNKSKHAEEAQLHSIPKILNSSSPPSSPAFLNGDNQKLVGLSNNTNINLTGDGNGVLKVPSLIN
ncbi:hypothetical protein QN277_026868 [Acacia crassicarpa]|uniref:Uncharacterized protein n=1 Tax=Acacia crassicarpa TaxID=499986 RepID=A0AAE1JB95_9FABA|nr:hypothetical protein QN277_026868 [Acacia crassicarpa]